MSEFNLGTTQEFITDQVKILEANGNVCTPTVVEMVVTCPQCGKCKMTFSGFVSRLECSSCKALIVITKNGDALPLLFWTKMCFSSTLGKTIQVPLLDVGHVKSYSYTSKKLDGDAAVPAYTEDGLVRETCVKCKRVIDGSNVHSAAGTLGVVLCEDCA